MNERELVDCLRHLNGTGVTRYLVSYRFGSLRPVTLAGERRRYHRPFRELS